MDLSDDELIHLYQEGDETAFNELLERNKKKIFSYISIIVKNNEVSNDLFQDTFVKIVGTLKKRQYSFDGKFLGWAIRIAHNVIMDHFRISDRVETVSSVITLDGEKRDIFEVVNVNQPTAEDCMIKRRNLLKIRELVDQLPFDQKEVVMLRHYYDMSFKEISAMTNVCINTSLGRMHHAIHNLKLLAEKNNIVI